MNLNVISLEFFSKDVKKLYKKNKELPQDLRTLNETLLENPKVEIELSSKLYKMRLENSSSNNRKVEILELFIITLMKKKIYIYLKSIQEPK